MKRLPCKQCQAGALPARRTPPISTGLRETRPMHREKPHKLLQVGVTPTPATTACAEPPREVIRLPDCKSGVTKQCVGSDDLERLNSQVRHKSVAPIVAVRYHEPWSTTSRKSQSSRRHFRRSFFVFTLNLTIGRFDLVEMGVLLRRRRRSHRASSEKNLLARLMLATTSKSAPSVMTTSSPKLMRPFRAIPSSCKARRKNSASVAE